MTSSILSVITKSGISEALTAGVDGPKIDISGFKLGSKSQAEGYVPSEDDTDIPSVVYTGTTDSILYTKISDDTISWRIVVDQDIGDFYIGAVSLLMSDGSPFAIASLPVATYKFKSDPPATIGNRKIFDMALTISGQNVLINLSIVVANEASWPEVANESLLPLPTAAPYSGYIVDNHTVLGLPALAVRWEGDWHYTPMHKNAGEGETVLAVNPAAFHPNSVIGTCVVYDLATQLYVPADPATVETSSIGIRSSSYEIISMGPVTFDDTVSITPLTPGATYFVGFDGNLTTTITNQRAGIAIDAYRFWCMMDGSGGLSGIYSTPVNTSYNKQIRLNNFPANTWTKLYSVPVGKRAFLTGLSCCSYSSTTVSQNLVTVRVHSSADNAYFWMNFKNLVPQQTTTELFRTPKVLYEGDQIDINTDNANLISIFGTIIENTDGKLFYKYLNLSSTNPQTLITSSYKLNLFSLVVTNKNAWPTPFTIEFNDSPVSMKWADSMVIPPYTTIEFIEKERYIFAGNSVVVSTMMPGELGFYLSGRVIP